MRNPVCQSQSSKRKGRGCRYILLLPLYTTITTSNDGAIGNSSFYNVKALRLAAEGCAQPLKPEEQEE